MLKYHLKIGMLKQVLARGVCFPKAAFYFNPTAPIVLHIYWVTFICIHYYLSVCSGIQPPTLAVPHATFVYSRGKAWEINKQQLQMHIFCEHCHRAIRLKSFQRP